MFAVGVPDRGKDPFSALANLRTVCFGIFAYLNVRWMMDPKHELPDQAPGTIPVLYRFDAKGSPLTKARQMMPSGATRSPAHSIVAETITRPSSPRTLRHSTNSSAALRALPSTKAFRRSDQGEVTVMRWLDDVACSAGHVRRAPAASGRCARLDWRVEDSCFSVRISRAIRRARGVRFVWPARALVCLLGGRSLAQVSHPQDTQSGSERLLFEPLWTFIDRPTRRGL